MSHDLYPVRIYYEAGRGCAKIPGRFKTLAAAPMIQGLPLITMIDYAPGVCAMVLPKHGERRDLTVPEIAAVHAWLAHVFLEPQT